MTPADCLNRDGKCATTALRVATASRAAKFHASVENRHC
jgi:hypothetical protein